MPIAALDACVLYQGMLTDLLLWLAEGKVFEPLWSDEMTDEWSRHLADRLPEDKIAYRREQVRTAFPAANVPADTKLLNERGLSPGRRSAGFRPRYYPSMSVVYGASTLLVRAPTG